MPKSGSGAGSLGFRVLRFWGYPLQRTMQNQMENRMETGLKELELS